MFTSFESCKTEDEISKQFPPAHCCPGIPSVNYGGEDYLTVEIGIQCWLAKNLNIGSFIVADTGMTNNNKIEKYCYVNNPALCNIYGGLYQWDEMMNYSNVEGSAGICPEGWHIPSEFEIDELETYIGSNMRRIKDYRDLHWGMSPSDSTIVLGFNALSGGYFWHQLHEFMGRHKNANYWTSSENDSTKARLFIIGYGNYNYQEDKLSAASVRCLKNKD